MNTHLCDVLRALAQAPYSSQRVLAEASGHSLGMVNRSLKELLQEGYLDEHKQLTAKAEAEFQKKAPKNAVILAAGYGMRMVPINTETPKALLEVNGERLIERLIKQLQEAGVSKIYVVVGFMKEQFEYLMDAFGVELIVNPDYAGKNNLYSLALAAAHLGNTYVIPCDLWCASNPFRRRELYSWYMVSQQTDSESSVRCNRKLELVKSKNGGNTMIGISYLLEDDAKVIRKRMEQLCREPGNEDAFWEEALYTSGNRRTQMCIPARVMAEEQVVEINTYEQLRQLDSGSNQLRSDAIAVAAEALQAAPEAVTNIAVLKKGMTNRSFLFECRGKKYIMRIPGEGTDKLINRAQEAAVYQAIMNLDICDNIVYMNPTNGYKITEYLEGARLCDPDNVADLEKCMKKLRAFHALELQVDHDFDIFRLIEFYESLWEGVPSAYGDYRATKENVLSLKPYVDRQEAKKVLTHIDAVPDNFLFAGALDGGEDLRLIDWEYAGMQDPHVDIAMFCIYALYDRQQIDRLIDIYFQEGCPEATRTKIYCYVAACGLLWSNWCEYKRNLGVEFGEYSLRQYRFAKDYYRIAMERIEKEGTCHA